jgi:5-formyltetrahydrofolate cyclo-ligase
LNTEDQKTLLRQQAKSVRISLADPEAGYRLARHVLASKLVPPQAAVAGFWPMADEIDTRFLLRGLFEAGHRVFLPETPEPGGCLRYRLWHPERPVLPGRFGTSHSDGEDGVPDVLFVPLLAFDRRGGRLGYGGGFYDRSLAALPGHRAIGCGYVAQEMRVVPMAPHDIRMQAIATESGVIRCRMS